VKQLVNKAASGDLVALRQLTALAGAAEEQQVPTPTRELSEDDQKVMAGVLMRFESSIKGEDDDENS